MNIMERLKGAMIAIVLLLLCFPATVAVTFISSPVWQWFEAVSGIESYGHHGPAEWCYLLVYTLLVMSLTLFWSTVQNDK